MNGFAKGKGKTITILRLALLLLPLALFSREVFAQAGKDLHESYDLNPGGVITIRNVSGSIQVTGWDEKKVRVDAVITASRAEDREKVRIQVTTAPDRLEITTVYGTENERRGNYRASVNYKVTIPRGAHLDSVSSVSGDISVTGVNGRVTLATVSGDVTARDIGGALRMRTVSGDASAMDLRAEASVTTTSGNARVERAAARVSARSVSGEVNVSEVAGDLEAASVSDDLVARGVEGRASLSNISGNIRASALRAGVRASSVSGDIEIRESRGNVSAESTSGSIMITQVDSQDVRLRSHSGQLRFQGRLSSPGLYEFDSFSGEVEVVIPADAEFTVRARTFNGQIASDFPLQPDPAAGPGTRNRRMQATVGQGGAQVSMTGFSASLKLRKQ
ncbi:MAG: DUF4097 family beta strand repeat-containing protein [Blastocatellia bacterium]